MRRTVLLAMTALVPAALNAPLPVRAASIEALLCLGDGVVRRMTVPVDQEPMPNGATPCCAKGCHAGSSRKRDRACC